MSEIPDDVFDAMGRDVPEIHPRLLQGEWTPPEQSSGVSWLLTWETDRGDEGEGRERVAAVYYADTFRGAVNQWLDLMEALAPGFAPEPGGSMLLRVRRAPAAFDGEGQ